MRIIKQLASIFRSKNKADAPESQSPPKVQESTSAPSATHAERSNASSTSKPRRCRIPAGKNRPDDNEFRESAPPAQTPAEKQNNGEPLHKQNGTTLESKKLKNDDNPSKNQRKRRRHNKKPAVAGAQAAPQKSQKAPNPSYNGITYQKTPPNSAWGDFRGRRGARGLPGTRLRAGNCSEGFTASGSNPPLPSSGRRFPSRARGGTSSAAPRRVRAKPLRSHCRRLNAYKAARARGVSS